jgi:hypothetical protein
MLSGAFRRLRPDVDIGGPEQRRVAIAEVADGVMQASGRTCRVQAGVSPSITRRQPSIEALRHLGGDGVEDGPLGSDDAGKAGQQQRAGEVDGLIGYIERTEGGLAGGQEGEPRIGQAEPGQVGQRGRAGFLMVIGAQGTARQIVGILLAVAARAACSVSIRSRVSSNAT